MNTFIEVITSNRFKSFYWRGGAMIVVATLNFIAADLGNLDLPTETVVFLGLVLGEITKAISNSLK